MRTQMGMRPLQIICFLLEYHINDNIYTPDQTRFNGDFTDTIQQSSFRKVPLLSLKLPAQHKLQQFYHPKPAVKPAVTHGDGGIHTLKFLTVHSGAPVVIPSSVRFQHPAILVLPHCACLPPVCNKVLLMAR